MSSNGNDEAIDSALLLCTSSGELCMGAMICEVEDSSITVGAQGRKAYISMAQKAWLLAVLHQFLNV